MTAVAVANWLASKEQIFLGFDKEYAVNLNYQQQFGGRSRDRSRYPLRSYDFPLKEIKYHNWPSRKIDQ